MGKLVPVLTGLVALAAVTAAAPPAGAAPDVGWSVAGGAGAAAPPHTADPPHIPVAPPGGPVHGQAAAGTVTAFFPLVVVARGGSRRNAPWRGLLSPAAVARGARGAVIAAGGLRCWCARPRRALRGTLPR